MPIVAFVPQAPKANSTICVLPRVIMPAAASRSTTVAVTGDTRSRQNEGRRASTFLDIQKVLECDGYAVQRTRSPAGLSRGQQARRDVGFLLVDFNKGVELFVMTANTL